MTLHYHQFIIQMHIYLELFTMLDNICVSWKENSHTSLYRMQQQTIFWLHLFPGKQG